MLSVLHRAEESSYKGNAGEGFGKGSHKKCVRSFVPIQDSEESICMAGLFILAICYAYTVMLFVAAGIVTYFLALLGSVFPPSRCDESTEKVEKTFLTSKMPLKNSWRRKDTAFGR